MYDKAHKNPVDNITNKLDSLIAQDVCGKWPTFLSINAVMAIITF